MQRFLSMRKRSNQKYQKTKNQASMELMEIKTTILSLVVFIFSTQLNLR